MDRIKIAIILPYFGTGGAEKMVAQLAANMDTTKFDVKVFCILGAQLGNHLERIVAENGIMIHYIGKKIGFSFSAIFKLFRSLDAFNPDVVHTHQYACLYTALWPFIRLKPFLHTFHTLPEIENRRLARRILTKFLVQNHKMIPIAISKFNQHLIEEYYSLKENSVHIVHNPVDVQLFSSVAPINHKEFCFISVGRFSREKNQKMIYEAFANFLKRGYNARLLMLGNGEEESSLKRLAKELGIDNRITYAGYVENVQDYLKTADVFLLSSFYEAQPLCVLEAMAAGLCVISTDVGGIKDIVTDNGILVPTGDTEAMTQAMELLYLNEPLRKKLSEQSSLHATNYDITNTVAGYSRLYRYYAGK